MEGRKCPKPNTLDTTRVMCMRVDVCAHAKFDWLRDGCKRDRPTIAGSHVPFQLPSPKLAFVLQKGY